MSKKRCLECNAINVELAQRCHNCGSSGFGWWGQVLNKVYTNADFQNSIEFYKDLSEMQAEELNKLRETNHTLAKALRFYAKETNWSNYDDSNFKLEIKSDDAQEFRRPKAIYIGGKLAREALKAYTKVEEIE